ncbi:hypothetical protein CYMTET_43267, partial [Cymbomonas tetramitiformis]
MIGIHPAYLKYVQFNLRGQLMWCSARPFEWYDFARIFTKVMRLLVECIRAPQCVTTRCRSVPRLREGHRGAVEAASGEQATTRIDSRQRGGLVMPAHVAKTRVLPYMDGFLMLCDSKTGASRIWRRVTKILHRLRMEPKEVATRLVKQLGRDGARAAAGMLVIARAAAGMLVISRAVVGMLVIGLAVV